MTKSKSTTPSYHVLKAELDAVLMELQREDLDVDQALIHYQRGLELIKQLETYLQGAKNRVKQIKAAFNNSGV